MPVLPGGPLIMRHSQLGPKHADDNKDTLIEVDSFVSVGKVQPFNVSISSSALLLVDLHAHLSPEPVCGYLGKHIFFLRAIIEMGCYKNHLCENIL